MLLSYTYLQEGQDGAATEQALRDVLVLEPNHQETLHNLRYLRSQQGRRQQEGVKPPGTAKE